MAEQRSLDFVVQEVFLQDIQDLNGVVSTKNTLRVLHLNIRSVSKHHKELDVMLQTIKKNQILFFVQRLGR